jgi:hypothetical protein
MTPRTLKVALYDDDVRVAMALAGIVRKAMKNVENQPEFQVFVYAEQDHLIAEAADMTLLIVSGDQPRRTARDVRGALREVLDEQAVPAVIAIDSDSTHDLDVLPPEIQRATFPSAASYSDLGQALFACFGSTDSGTLNFQEKL